MLLVAKFNSLKRSDGEDVDVGQAPVDTVVCHVIRFPQSIEKVRFIFRHNEGFTREHVAVFAQTYARLLYPILFVLKNLAKSLRALKWAA